MLETFVTHPTEIYRLTYRMRGPPGSASAAWPATETLGVTGPHPLWVASRPTPGFFPAQELRPGDQLALASGGSAEVTSIRLESAPAGRSLATHNFEVADFHTYFAGRAGVWVHNSGKSDCDEIFDFLRVLLEPGMPFHGRPWAAFDHAVTVAGKGKNPAIFGWSAAEIMRKDLENLPLVERVAQWPSHRQVTASISKIKGLLGTTELGGMDFGFIKVPDWLIQERVDLGSLRSFRLESHHGIPKKIQEWLGLTKDKDSVPAYLTTMLEHQGAGEGIHQVLAKKMGDKIGTGPVPLNGAKPQQFVGNEHLLKEALQETYEEFGLEHFWEVCEHWIGAP